MFRLGLKAVKPLVKRARTNITFTDWKELQPRKEKKSKGLIALLTLMPIISFGLGTWQVKRLKWKQELIASAEDQLSRPPLALPNRLDPDAISDFNYRRVSAEGTWDHANEMVVGPRLHKGQKGYYVVTPFVRKDGSTLLINRGWIVHHKRSQASRPQSLTKGPLKIRCMLRAKPKKNSFTLESEDPKEFHFMDIDAMAARTGAQPIYLEQVEQDTGLMPEQEISRGIPVGFPAKVEFRNTHFQYILTWYGLSILTGVMLVGVLRQSKQKNVGDALKAKVEHARKWQ